jgi:hypothetical protein
MMFLYASMRCIKTHPPNFRVGQVTPCAPLGEPENGAHESDAPTFGFVVNGSFHI